MATILTNKFKVRNAKAFMELFRTNHVYMFIGRNRAWPNEASPPTPSNLTALSDEFDVWNDIIVLKKVYISDVSLVIPRYDWVNTISYTEYEHDKTDLFSRDGDPTNPFYVVRQEYSGMYTVWKVIANVKNTASTSAPTWANGLSATHFRDNLDTDGYLWKYMYRISSNDMNKFGTTVADSTGNKWIPIKNTTTAGVSQDSTSQWDVQRQAVHGGVHYIRPASAIVAADVNKKVRLDGDGTDFDATIRLISSTYYVDVADPGKNYTYVRRVLKETSIGSNTYAPDTNLTAILSPINGHGFDPVEEFGGYRLMVHAELSGTTSFGQQGSSYQHTYADGTNTDFRTVGLLIDPIKSVSSHDDILNGEEKGTIIVKGDRQSAVDSTNLVKVNYTSITTASPLTTAADWIEKEVIQLQGSSPSNSVDMHAIGRVVDIDTTNKDVYIQPYAGSEAITKFSNSSTYYIFLADSGEAQGVDVTNYIVPGDTGGVVQNDLIPYTGDVLFLDNRVAITRYSDRTETVRLVIEF
tara:strand:+ start:654 stop:2225 length:1572 start_codon:yes stop_codon:yes gene_type:complete